jgi:hypothetical protein
MNILSTIASVLAGVVACGCTEPHRDAFHGSVYALEQRGGEFLPISLDNNTVAGTAHYSLIADTLRFDQLAPLITGTNVERLDYIGSTTPPTFEHYTYVYTIGISGSEGTGTFKCFPANAPCAFLTITFSASNDTLYVHRQSTQVVDTYLRLR